MGTNYTAQKTDPQEAPEAPHASTVLSRIPPLELDLDLMQIETPKRFESLCARLARREFPERFLVSSGIPDGGRDVTDISYLVDYMKVSREGGFAGETVWQCKFIKRLDAATKRSIVKSIQAVRSHGYIPVTRWILCIPIDPTEPFIAWLRQQIEPLGWRWEIWGRKELLEKLEKNSDLVQTFFYSAYEKLRRHFAVDNLELFQVRLDDDCQWIQPDASVLNIGIRGDVVDPVYLM
ncbi:MAG TPA: hypothetical protein VHO25_21755 [Polyangiaceae bacterium]|nr:hypothetical protein [Polyangiaceae bacterium]